MQKERNISEILIAKSVAATADMENTSVNNHVAAMNVGELVIISPSGTVVDATGTLPESFKIGVKLSDGTMQWSDTIQSKGISRISSTKYIAPTLLVDYVGYNGTTGAIDTINNNLYYLRLNFLPTDAAGFAMQEIRWGGYKSDSTTTQSEVAHGVAENLIGNLSRLPEKQANGIDIVKVELVNSGTSIATSGGVISVTKGSKLVAIAGTGADAGKYNADAADIVAGDYLRIGHATTKTFPVYKVQRVVSGGGAATMVVELAMPYQGDSNLAIAAASVGVIPAADVANFGIKLSANFPKFSVGKFHYSVPRWNTTITDFGSTLLTNAVAATEGTGDYRQISQFEQQFQGNEGNYYRLDVFSTFRNETAVNGQYALVIIEHVDNMLGNLGQEERSLKTTYVACAKGNGTTYSDANTGFGTILNAYVLANKIPLSFTTNATIATEINS
jgi:hypothetical protein